MSYTLSIVVHGAGTDPNNRSHWAFSIHRNDAQSGTLLHVVVAAERPRLIYQFDRRTDYPVRSRNSEGSFAVAALTIEQAREAMQIVSEEEAPRDGRERCQDWVLRAIISLEAEELVAPGTSEFMEQLVGQPASLVARAVGRRWNSTR